MTGRRSAWSHVGEWDDDDPALTRMRDALALGASETPPEAPGRPEPSAVAPVVTSEDERAELAVLAERLKAGDVSVRQRLAALLERLR